ncbi:MAG: flavodoxin domain-containing protein [Bacteroidales bacterium]|nr:flavodoxin domain-containing protein [Bacteroidales bacterium]
MGKTLILYWPAGGNVEKIATKVYSKLQTNKADLICLNNLTQTSFAEYDLIIAGGSTVGAETWNDATGKNLWSKLFSQSKPNAFQGKKVALFGLGDQILYPHNFADAMLLMKDDFEKAGAVITGKWPTDGYIFSDSASVSGNYFIGLALDEDRQPELSEERIEKWIKTL